MTNQTPRPFTTVVETLTDDQLVALNRQIVAELKKRSLWDSDHVEPTPNTPEETEPTQAPVTSSPYAHQGTSMQGWSASSSSNMLGKLSSKDLDRFHSDIHKQMSETTLSHGPGVEDLIRTHSSIVREMVGRDMIHVINSPMDFATVQALDQATLLNYTQLVKSALTTQFNTEYLQETSKILLGLVGKDII